MFSPNVQTDFKESLAISQYATIEDICKALNQEAEKQKFFDQSATDMGEKANSFVESFAYENGMQSRTVLPLMWSFSVGDQKLFDDGVIELMHDDGVSFSYTKVDSSKITDQ